MISSRSLKKGWIEEEVEEGGRRKRRETGRGRGLPLWVSISKILQAVAAARLVDR
jgi:hypothetical protein